MTFVYPALALGFLLALLPLLIHLINMMRHRRVEWAAMEFLLKSYKKHRKWVWLKQLLLLLLRMAAIALLVAMLAQWITRGQWTELFGGKTTHHYVLLDDSYSMSERIGSTTAFEQAEQFLQQLGDEAVEQLEQQGAQKFTLIRFSQAAGLRDRADMSIGDIGALADMNAEEVTADFDVQLQEQRNQFEVTELSVGPRMALDMVTQLLDQNQGENRAIYLVSDFRNNEWSSPEGIAESLRELDKTDADLHFIKCAREVQNNLAIWGLSPADETRAAGVPLFMNVEIKNYGKQVERNVQVTMRTFFHVDLADGEVSADDLVGEADEIFLPPVASIGPGETLTTRVQVYFPQAGQHVVQAELKDGDAVKADNMRWSVVDFPDSEKVLIVDGSGEQFHSYYLESVFRPGASTNTGVQPEVRNDPAYLRNVSQDELRKFSAIYLLNVPTLETRAVKNLESYVQSGGGLCIFVGDQVNSTFYNNNLFKDGEGLLPLKLGLTDLLGTDFDEGEPDVIVTDHPVFEIFAKERDPIVNRVTVEQYLKPHDSFELADHPTVTVAATLRNGDPLAVEKTFGRGRVVLFTTTVAPIWNDWGLNPFLVVVGLKLQSHLAATQRLAPEYNVANPLDISLAMERYTNNVKFFLPNNVNMEREEVEVVADPGKEGSPLMRASLGGESTAASRETARSGIYDVVLTEVDGKPEVRRYAVNLDPNEGDLALADQGEMLLKLDPIKPTVRFVEEYAGDIIEQAGFNRAMLLLLLLVGALVAEQLLAYSASYHPPSRRA